MINFHAAYLKLTLWYLLIVTTISIGFSFYLYRTTSAELGRGFRRQATSFRDTAILPGSMAIRIPNDIDQLIIGQFNESKNRLITNLIYFNLLILVLAGIGSYYLAKRTLRPIEEVLDLQNRFTADASHELRTPLTAMKTEIEVSLRDKNPDPAEARKLLESNLEEIAKLESLSNALLKLSRYQNNNRADFQNVPLNEVVVEAYGCVAKLASQKSIEIICKPELDSEQMKIILKGDKQSLIELFVILLENAVKYSPAESKIYILIEQSNKNAIITIRDQGIGIKASDLPYIFNRFYRADTSRSKEKVDGYGLGLSIAKQIVERHKGNITAESKSGRGSKFTVRLALV